VAARVGERRKHPVGNLGPHEPKRLDRHLSRRFVGLALGIAHHESPARDFDQVEIR
jgi:hypothetical protein